MRSKEPLRLTLTERFIKTVLELETDTRRKLKKQLGLLASDPRHPSLRDFRFTFEYGEKHEIILRVGGPHDPTLKKS